MSTGALNYLAKHKIALGMIGTSLVAGLGGGWKLFEYIESRERAAAEAVNVIRATQAFAADLTNASCRIVVQLVVSHNWHGRGRKATIEALSDSATSLIKEIDEFLPDRTKMLSSSTGSPFDEARDGLFDLRNIRLFYVTIAKLATAFTQPVPMPNGTGQPNLAPSQPGASVGDANTIDASDDAEIISVAIASTKRMIALSGIRRIEKDCGAIVSLHLPSVGGSYIEIGPDVLPVPKLSPKALEEASAKIAPSQYFGMTPDEFGPEWTLHEQGGPEFWPNFDTSEPE
jgi:hypothetical protein